MEIIYDVKRALFKRSNEKDDKLGTIKIKLRQPLEDGIKYCVLVLPHSHYILNVDYVYYILYCTNQ